MKTCPVCDGDGKCKNEFHEDHALKGLSSAMGEMLWGAATCPACGEEYRVCGKCSTCGGTGEVDD